MHARSRAALFLALVFAIALLGAGVAAAAGWRVPVPGPVVDPWRPPAHRYAAGNRGIDIGTEAGEPVHSAGPGVVSFAGPVGGRLHVVVDHGDGLRTTYAGLASLSVTAGEALSASATVGTAGTRVHFGLRRHGEYLNPNVLFGRPRLVPLEQPQVPARG